MINFKKKTSLTTKLSNLKIFAYRLRAQPTEPIKNHSGLLTGIVTSRS